MSRVRSAITLALALLAAPPLASVAHAEAEPVHPRVLVVVPLGNPSADVVEVVVKSFRERFKLEVRVAPPQPLPPEAWYAPRKRWRAEKILDALDAMPFEDAWRVAAITEAPISTTKGKVHDWGIAGLGSLGGKSSVFTSYLFQRFKTSDRKTYLRFMENLVLHELGHTLGLDHCPVKRCIMADAEGNAIKAARISINEFCPRCYGAIKEHLTIDALRGDWTEAELEQIAPR